MRRINSFGTLSLSFGLSFGLGALGCNDDVTVMPPETGTGTDSETGDGDGDGDGDPGDGDGDGDGDGEPCPEGTQDCPCGVGDFCDSPLECIDGICQEGEPDPVCGNGVLEGDEQCDDGPANDNTAACKLDCTPQMCGDGFVGASEACDDGNVEDADECTNACGLPGCGDGILQVGEACDDGNLEDGDACLSSCIAASCGDLVVQQGVEACDDGNDIDTDACLPGCIAASCGDSLIWADTEQCDDGNMVDLDGCNSNCNVTGGLIWEQTYSAGAASCDFFYGVDVAPNGRVAVVGILNRVSDPMQDCRIIVRVYEEDGTLVWSSIPTTGPHCDEGAGVDWDAQGYLWVTGTVYDANNLQQQWVRRYDPAGNSLWSRSFGSTGVDNAYGIALDGDGNGIMVGSVTTQNNGVDATLRAIAPNGNSVWAKEYHFGATDAVRDVITAGDDIYVAGYIDVVGQNSNGWAARFDMQGNPVWQHTYNGMLNSLDRAGGIARADDGTLAIAGLETGQFNQDVFTQRLDAAGQTIWTRNYNNPGMNWSDRGQEVDIDADGNIVVAGQTWDPGLAGGNFDTWLRKYDADGNEVWTDITAGDVDGEDAWWAIDIADNGEILVSGGITDDPANCADAVLRRYAR
jgi:cysteine-rich repeat protein